MGKEPLVGVSAWRLVTPRLNPACFERRQLLPIKNDQNSQCQKQMVNRRTCRGYQSQAGNFSCITTVVLKSFTLAWKSCKLDINAMKENKSPFGTNHYNCKTEIATIQGSLKYCAQLVKCRKWPGCFPTFQWSQNLSTPKIIRLCVETFGLVLRYCHAGKPPWRPPPHTAHLPHCWPSPQLRYQNIRATLFLPNQLLKWKWWYVNKLLPNYC